jgi:hypothetical protein
MGGEMDELEKKALVHVLAKFSKNQYRELLAHRMLAQHMTDEGYLDQNGNGVNGLLESARQSPELKQACADYNKAIDSRLPPSDEELLEMALTRWFANLPPSGLPN